MPIPCRSIWIWLLTICSSAGVSTRHSINAPNSNRDRTNDNTDLAVNSPLLDSSTVSVSDSFVVPRYQPIVGTGLVPLTSQVLENRWSSRSGPRILEFFTGAPDSSNIWINDGGTKPYRDCQKKYKTQNYFSLILTINFQLYVERSHIRAVLTGFDECGFANICFLVAHLDCFQMQFGQRTVRVMFNGYSKTIYICYLCIYLQRLPYLILTCLWIPLGYSRRFRRRTPRRFGCFPWTIWSNAIRRINQRRLGIPAQLVDRVVSIRCRPLSLNSLTKNTKLFKQEYAHNSRSLFKFWRNLQK